MDKTKEYLKKALANKKKNANRRGIAISLTIEDIETLYKRNDGVCDYTGLHFDMDQMYQTIERIDDSKGYVKGNLCLVGSIVNTMKDSFLDKGLKHTVKLDYRGFHIIGCLRYKLTKEYFNHLSKKYNSDFEYKREEDKYLTYFKEAVSVEELQRLDDIQEEENMNKVNDKKVPSYGVPQVNIKNEVTLDLNVEQKSVENTLPLDVQIANYYSAIFNVAKSQKMPFELTFSEFKAKFSGKSCRFSGVKLDNNNKFVLVRDKNKSFSSDNITLVDKSFGIKLQKASEEFGMSIDELSKMFKRLG